MPQHQPQLPDGYEVRCTRVQADFAPGGRYWSVTESCLAEAEKAGVSRQNATALLIGLAACEAWRANPQRQTWLEGAQFSLERVRPVSETRYGSQAFTTRQAKSREYSNQGVRDVENLIIYGFVLRCGQSRMSKTHWRSLLPALAKIFSKENNDDPEGDVYEFIRHRIRRLRKKKNQDEIRAQAVTYFEGVYATLSH